MHRLSAILLLAALGIAGCQQASTTGKPTTAEATAAYPGATIETAVILAGPTNEGAGVQAEHAYTAKHFPNARWSGQSLINKDGRAYDCIELTEGGGTRQLYFDISNWFGKW